MRGKDFLTIKDFTTEELTHLLDMARDIKANPHHFTESLKGKTLALIFEKPSLRTRVTFDVGIQQLGGFSIYLSPAEINLGKRESVYDVAKNLERMVQGIMIRTFGHDIVERMAEYASIPIINGLTDFSHPCQAMADYLTLREYKEKLAGAKLAYVGDGNNVSNSLMFAGARLGVHVAVATPPGFEPKADVTEWATRESRKTGATCLVTNDPAEAVRDADAVYTDVWASMGQEAEADERALVFPAYALDAEKVAVAKPDVTVMHCLPAHRGQEIADEVIDGPHSVVWDQAENRMHTQKALMLWLLGLV
jgi:ornithine carbamoyltransferase